jgi:ketosteroid isomerase-like protein
MTFGLGAIIAAMRQPSTRPLRIVIHAALVASGCLARSPAQDYPSPQSSDHEGIEHLHRTDIAATLTGDPAQLAALWDRDGVLFDQGQPAVVGERALRAMYDANRTKVLSYEPRLQPAEISGQLATEWGTYSARFQEPEQPQPSAVRGRYLRVMKRQPDGTWRFLQIMLQDGAP